MKAPWFRSCGWFWLPISVPGIVATLLPLVFAVQVFLAVDRRSHSVSDTLFGIFPYWAPAFLLWAGLATKTSRSGKTTRG